MKLLNSVIIVGAAILIVIAYSFTNESSEKNVNSVLSDSSSKYADGTYLGQSQATYAPEPFWGHIQITVDNGLFTAIHFKIRDSSLQENVDSLYGTIHYAGNPTYMQQCVEDGHGIEIYPQRLLESQNVDNVDAITYATWSYDIFIASAKDALAQGPTAINGGIRTDKIYITVQPNPFSSRLILKFGLAEMSRVNLSIYNSKGRMVKQLVDQVKTAGSYSVQWDDSSPSGIYYYRMCAKDITVSSKVVKF